MLHFLGIGAQKAGTTWLWEMLRQHPGISFPGGKEVHFWDKHRHRGIEWYRRLFDVPDGRLHGEITPAYAVLPHADIVEIHRMMPELRLIITLRNPVERAWSAAKMEIARAGGSVHEVPDERYLREFHAPASLVRGDYEACIRRWRSVFPPEQLLVMRFERIAADPASFLGRCFEHLGADATLLPRGVPVGVPVLAGPSRPIPPSLRAALHDLYFDRIRGLADYLGEDLSEWLEDGQAHPAGGSGGQPW
ncbi:MAG: sulfotransferase domain-containing protein [Phycisphaerales bacterium]|nr:sulfotransferase domain-containing protein [Phycisphaerales bacterium]